MPQSGKKDYCTVVARLWLVVFFVWNFFTISVILSKVFLKIKVAVLFSMWNLNLKTRIIFLMISVGKPLGWMTMRLQNLPWQLKKNQCLWGSIQHCFPKSRVLGFPEDSESLFSPWLPRNPSKRRPHTQKGAPSFVVSPWGLCPEAALAAGR